MGIGFRAIWGRIVTGHEALAAARGRGAAVRCEDWAEGTILRADGGRVIVVRGDGSAVDYVPGEPFGADPAELDRDDWHVVIAAEVAERIRRRLRACARREGPIVAPNAHSWGWNVSVRCNLYTDAGETLGLPLALAYAIWLEAGNVGTPADFAATREWAE